MASYRRRCSDFLVERIDNDMILVDVHGGQVHELNPTAAWLWDRLEHRVDAAALAEALCQRYDVSWERASIDVEQILLRFVASGLLSKE